MCGVPYASSFIDPLTFDAQNAGCLNRTLCSTENRVCNVGTCICGAIYNSVGGVCRARCHPQHTANAQLEGDELRCICNEGYDPATRCEFLTCPTSVRVGGFDFNVVERRFDPVTGTPSCYCPAPFLPNCTAHLCLNGGVPVMGETGPTCRCEVPFTGALCQSDPRLEPPPPFDPPTNETGDAPLPPENATEPEVPAEDDGEEVAPDPDNPPEPPPPVDAPPAVGCPCVNGRCKNGDDKLPCLCQETNYGNLCQFNYCGLGNSRRICHGGSCRCACDSSLSADASGNCTVSRCGLGHVIRFNLSAPCDLCLPGFTLNGTECTRSCPPNAVFSHAAGACVCLEPWSGANCSVAPPAAVEEEEPDETPLLDIVPGAPLCASLDCAEAFDGGPAPSFLPPPGVSLGNRPDPTPFPVPVPVELVYGEGRGETVEGLSNAELAGIVLGALLAATGLGVWVFKRCQSPPAAGYRDVPPAARAGAERVGEW